ncbi:hypothetical protein B9Z19DRAFT_1120688 [Tuber borchii]|uniref:Uncharacterized protein n=1 Tax=Tuber borchii TaxID=42251 RepID=A0A2T7A410_TUBBO|nr:hypothetical protein B9Z19DRAFT_1120688 [Tuber borchii]
MGPRGIKFLTEGERLAALETEHAFYKGSIVDGIKTNSKDLTDLNGLWFFTALFGFGALVYKTMICDGNSEDRIKRHIDNAVAASQLETAKDIDHAVAVSQLKTARALIKENSAITN